ncbi:MAG: hypothetical protein ACI93R_000493 [Flavobacteriales bacterium]|jgi:hypothetical protein
MSKGLSKTQKKLDKVLSDGLQFMCETQLKDFESFEWITHHADYANFPASLIITCVFNNEAAIHTLKSNDQQKTLQKLIQSHLLKLGIRFKQVNQQIRFDSEEACKDQNDGDWRSRFKRLEGRAVPKNRP